MSKVTVLFFATDAHSYQGAGRRLLLDEDVRTIHEKLRSARFRESVRIDVRWAARPDDLLQALNERQPQIVHFSGHGGDDGLVLLNDFGDPQPVPASVLAGLFGVFTGIRVVVLSACYSFAQAEAIARTVDCVIGTHGPLTDEGAITFNSCFYRAIAFGRSVGDAFAQAKLALSMLEPPDPSHLELLVREGADPASLVLVADPPVEERQFREVGYSARAFGLFHFRDFDVGTLTVHAWHAEFTGERGTVRIDNVREVSHGRQSGDMFANWVKVRYGSDGGSIAYLARQTMLSNLLGGSEDLYAALRDLVPPREAPPDG